MERTDKILALALASLLTAGAVIGSAPPIPAFGTCAHLARGDEFGQLDEELDLMKAAGIRWARADFSWGDFEKTDGRFTFERYDQVIAAAEARDVHILPILCYNSPWAGLAHENMEAWTRYVRTVTNRYGNRLKYWEVWNEPNIGFWKPKPNPEQYASLLKATHETIKAVDPGLQVLYGGTAGIPLDFIRKTLEHGAAKHFDVMAIHPYCYPLTVEASGRLDELAKLNVMLEEFGATERIWITELGWPTHRDPTVAEALPVWESLVTVAAGKQFPDKSRWRIAVLTGPHHGTMREAAEAAATRFEKSDRWDCRRVSLADLAGLTPKTSDVLLGLFGEQFPKRHFGAMARFVEQGGLLVHFGSVPLYYAKERIDGKWQERGAHAGDGYWKKLHLGWEASWTREGLPEAANTIAPADGIKGIALKGKITSKRWFTDQRLQGDDQFIPLLSAYNGDQFVGHPSALYLLRSTLRGAVLVNSMPVPRPRGVDHATQAAMLSRAYLSYLAHGVEACFWYEFRDGGRDPGYNEHNFGMIDLGLKPKPAYETLGAWSKLLGDTPTFAGAPAEVEPGLLRVEAKGANGRTYAIYWARDEPVDLAVDSGRICAVLDHLKKPHDIRLAGSAVTIPIGLAPVLVDITGEDPKPIPSP